MNKILKQPVILNYYLFTKLHFVFKYNMNNYVIIILFHLSQISILKLFIFRKNIYFYIIDRKLIFEFFFQIKLGCDLFFNGFIGDEYKIFYKNKKKI